MKTPAPCVECNEGTLRTVTEDYEVLTADGNRIVVPKVELVRCDHCGETLIPAASSRRISEFQAKATEQLTPRELHGIFERSDLTQKEFAEALGLGEKTFHRWLKGTQIVSRSMGYYLRAMDRVPGAFDYVKERRWRLAERKPALKSTMEVGGTVTVFVALERRVARGEVFQPTRNPARGLVLGAVHICD